MQINKFTALASGARTVTGTADLGTLPGDFAEMNIYVAVSAVAGTSPSMTVTYQCSHDGTDWYDHTSGAAITAAGNQLIKVSANAGKHGRLSYAISGTSPSFTFSATTEGKRNE